MNRSEITRSDMVFTVQFDEPVEGFSTDTLYTVIARDGRDFLLIDENARFRWVPVVDTRPTRITVGKDVLFDRFWFEKRRKYESLIGKRVIVRSADEMGVPGETRDHTGLFSFLGRLDSFEQDLVTLVDENDPALIAKITTGQIHSLDPA